MSRARPLAAKLFLEGVEVPFLGATITSAVNMASIAYIDLVPHHSIMNIKPRTHVLLSVRNYHDKDENYPYVKAWEGEVFGVQFGKTPQSRQFTISCIDTTSYWDNVLNYFFNSQQSLAKGFDAIGVGLDVDTAKKLGVPVLSTVHSTASFFRKIMDEVLLANPPKGDFLDAFIEVLRRVGEVNEFYKGAQQRLRVNDQMVLRSSGQLRELLKQEEALNWFNGIVGQSSGFSTLRNVVNDLMSIIFHDSVTVPFPARVPTSRTLSGSSVTRNLANTDKDGKRYTLGTFVFKPNLFMIAPPMCNVFFPDEYSSFQFNRNFFREPTRMVYTPELPLPADGGRVFLPHAFAPKIFQRFMYGTGKPLTDDEKKSLANSDYDFGIPTGGDLGYYGKPVEGNPATPTMREGQLLTNEERYKGIIFAKESMVPATNEFRSALSDLERANFSEKVANYLFLKKRFQTRELQITSHLKLSVVPGFPVLVLDDSQSGQNVVAYCESVTHRIYATEGGYTNVTLSYARTVQEQQASSTTKDDPLIPPWFQSIIFGSVGSGAISQDAAAEIKENMGSVSGKTFVGPSGEGLSEFYKDLLGDRGSKAITDLYSGEKTLVGAVARLISEYRKNRSNSAADIQDFIAKMSDRDYVRLRDAFAFLGASTTAADFREDNSFTEFTGQAFQSSQPIVGEQIQKRRAIITAYRDALKERRGFRG